MSSDDEKRARFMSTAGPSLPVTTKKKTDDVVPPGSAWLEQLHAPESAEKLTEPAPASSVSDDFDDEKPGRRKKPITETFKAKSAVSLVEELNAQSTKARPPRGGTEDRAAQARAISAVKIDGPEEIAPKKRMSAKVWVGIMLIIVGGLVAIAWTLGFQEPAPESARDHTELEAKITLRRKAIKLVNQGHEFAVQGPKKTEAAIDSYQEALKLDPALASAHKGLGSVLLREKKVEKALEHYRKYIELEPKADDAEAVRAILEKHTDDPMRPKGGLK